MRAVDTNVLVRLLTRDNARQVRAAESYVSRGAWVSHLALAEVTWVLSAVYQRERASIAAAVEMLLGHETLALQDEAAVRGALRQFERHRGVTFSDCLMVELARRAGHGPCGTFDRLLGKLDGAEHIS